MYCFHIKTNDPYDETQGQAQLWVTLTYLSRSQRLINLGSYKLYIAFLSIQFIELYIHEDGDFELFCCKYCHNDISENSRSGGEEIEEALDLVHN